MDKWPQGTKRRGRAAGPGGGHNGPRTSVISGILPLFLISFIDFVISLAYLPLWPAGGEGV